MKIRIFLSLVFFLGLVACDSSVEETASVGKALMPPVPLTGMVLVDDQNNPLPVDLFKKQYTYVLLADSACDDFCQQYIALTGKTISQTTVSKPVKQLLLLGYEPEKDWLEKIKRENPAITVAVLTRPIWAIFTLPFSQVASDMLGAPLFLVDPRGFIVMAYDDLNEAGPLITDLKSLDSKS